MSDNGIHSTIYAPHSVRSDVEDRRCGEPTDRQQADERARDAAHACSQHKVAIVHVLMTNAAMHIGQSD